MSNMEIWDKLKVPPPDALKKIKGGRLKGMSDINPQWRYEVMTEHFGMCGVGWKYEIDRTWTELASYDQITQFAQISLYVKHEENWSDAIPAVGGSMLVTKESGGLHTSDEAVKMAVTDALGTAMKMLGVASEVYRGNMDGSKYSKEVALLGFQALLDKYTGAKNKFEVENITKKYFNDIKACSKTERDDLKSHKTSILKGHEEGAV